MLLDGGPIPVIYVHKGNQEYFKQSLLQTRFVMPNSEIYILGDESNRYLKESFNWFDMDEFFSSADNFAPSYIHMSLNPFNFELFCIQRWFVLNEFLKANDIHQFLYLDSDVLIYQDFSKDIDLINHIRDFDLTITDTNAGTSLLNSQFVADFCTYMNDTYLDKSLIKRLKDTFDSKLDFSKTKKMPSDSAKQLALFEGDSIQDMALLTAFLRSSNYRAADLALPDLSFHVNQVINFPRCSNFFNTGAIAAVIFKKRMPYGISQTTLKPIRIVSLHFGGNAKKLLSSFTTYDKEESWISPNFDIDQLAYIWNLDKKQVLIDLTVARLRKMTVNAHHVIARFLYFFNK